MKKQFGLILIFILLFSLSFALTIEEINSTNEKTPLLFFYRPTCGHCNATIDWLDSIKGNYENVEVIYINIDEENELFWEVVQNYGISDPNFALPVLFMGENYFIGPDGVKINLEKAMDEIEVKKDIVQTKDPLEKQEVNLLYVLMLAFVDAVNPCELAVLIILMTAILTRYPKQKKKALKAGLLFSLAIFLMYFIFGLFIVIGFNMVSGVTGLGGNLFIGILAALAIFLGLLNVKDALWYGSGGFIMEVPQKWRPKMKSIINGTTSPKGAFVVGLIVSFFLTPCTAGPYFVFGGILSTVSLFEAIPYMLIYMCIFIAPMVLISLFTYFGFAKVEDMGGWRERNLKKLHWVAGLLMLGIGVWMLLVSFGIL
jgi:thiol:disulfide interchange protein